VERKRVNKELTKMTMPKTGGEKKKRLFKTTAFPY
jgi:hypothetical protein